MTAGDLGPTEPCKTCRAPIVWAQTTTAGKPMPLNPTPSEHGNVNVSIVAGVPVATVIGRPAARAAMRANGMPLYLSHFTDCPHAHDWRTRR